MPTVWLHFITNCVNSIHSFDLLSRSLSTCYTETYEKSGISNYKVSNRLWPKVFWLYDTDKSKTSANTIKFMDWFKIKRVRTVTQGGINNILLRIYAYLQRRNTNLNAVNVSFRNNHGNIKNYFGDNSNFSQCVLHVLSLAARCYLICVPHLDNAPNTYNRFVCIAAILCFGQMDMRTTYLYIYLQYVL